LDIPEIPLRLDPQTEAAQRVVGFEWAGGNIGKRSKVGGSPDWLRGDASPRCSCGRSMSFYGQLDSIGDTVCLCDAGMVYVFVCFDCFKTASVLQSG
jgi:hypothetical protein